MDQAIDDGTTFDFDRIVDSVVRDLVSVRHRAGSRWVTLPLLYPDGSSVTVRIEAAGEQIRVSDDGFAYRITESIGEECAFAAAAAQVARRWLVRCDQTIIYIDVPPDTLFRAICDVAIASWQVAENVCSAVDERVHQG
ncbi:MAG: hypothetical protein GVY13_02095 [Alphaproteobacteria bacterium]|jgi:hypothetical protein|nr:hypothetical protein [Alphaproteobacteria bacterium]